MVIDKLQPYLSNRSFLLQELRMGKKNFIFKWGHSRAIWALTSPQKSLLNLAFLGQKIAIFGFFMDRFD